MLNVIFEGSTQNSHIHLIILNHHTIYIVNHNFEIEWYLTPWFLKQMQSLNAYLVTIIDTTIDI